MMGSLAVEQPMQWLISSPHCHRLQLTSRSSPVDSPPVAKKFLRSSCSQKPHHVVSSRSSLLDAAASGECSSIRSASILKSVDYNRSKSWPAGQSTAHRPVATPSRRVSFDQTVAVVVYDRADGELVCRASQQLNTQPKDRRQFVSRTLFARLHKSTCTPPPTFDEVPRHYCSGTSLTPSSDVGMERRPLPSIQSPPVARDNISSQTASGNIEFAFHEDRSGQLLLSFTVPLGRGVAAGDAVVKANVAGNKVRVLGTRTATSDTGSTTPARVRQSDGTASTPGVPVRQAFATRYALPMDVDPYAITARMDSTGNLYVEAPVMTDERRRRRNTDAASSADCTTVAN